MKQYPQKFKEFVWKAANAASELVGTQEYDLEIEWSVQPHEKDTEDTIVTATVWVDSTYLHTSITVFPPLYESFLEKEYEVIGKKILHEFCHILIEPVQKLFMWDASSSQKNGYQAVIERQTQRVTNAISRLLPSNYWTRLLNAPNIPHR